GRELTRHLDRRPPRDPPARRLFRPDIALRRPGSRVRWLDLSSLGAMLRAGPGGALVPPKLELLAARVGGASRRARFAAGIPQSTLSLPRRAAAVQPRARRDLEVLVGRQ